MQSDQGPSAPTNSDAKIDFVNVVFSAEIPLLVLQARSMAKFLPRDLVGKIILIANERFEDETVAALREMVPEFGELAEFVEILRPDEIFRWDVGPGGIKSWLDNIYTRNRGIIPIERAGGWQGHRGWQIQQAMKLTSVRRTISDYIVILDAKNHFLSEISFSDFVAPSGKPLTFYEKICHWQKDWLKAAAEIIEIDPDIAKDDAYMPTITPFVVRRAFLSDALDAIETAIGPVQSHFGTKRGGAMEFTLLFAFCLKRHGSIFGEFELGLAEPAHMRKNHGASDLDALIELAEKGEAKTVGLHRQAIPELSQDQRSRLARMWVNFGLTDTADEGMSMMDQVAAAQ